MDCSISYQQYLLHCFLEVYPTLCLFHHHLHSFRLLDLLHFLLLLHHNRHKTYLKHLLFFLSLLFDLPRFLYSQHLQLHHYLRPHDPYHLFDFLFLLFQCLLIPICLSLYSYHSLLMKIQMRI